MATITCTPASDECRIIGTFAGSNVDAGTFSMTANGVTNSNYVLGSTFTSDEYTITKAVPEAKHFNIILPDDLTYDGGEKEVEVELKSGLTGIGDITVSYSDNVNVGTCKVYATFTDGSNFTAAEDVELGSFEIKERAPSSPGLSGGAIAGIVAGVIVGLGGVAAVVIIFLRKNFYI